MANVVNPVITKGLNHAVVQWKNLDGTTNTSGALTQMPGFELESVHIDGTTLTGAITMWGTNYDDGTGTVVALKDQSNTAITTTAAAAFFLRVGMNFIQPKVASGSSGVNVTAYYRRAL